jgi:hypothetical protein
MTSEERDTLNALCARIQQESDPKKFTTLLTELDRLLEQQQSASRRKPASRAEITALGFPR